MIWLLVALFWAAFIFGLYALDRWGAPLYGRLEMLALWDAQRMVDRQR